MTAPVPCPFCQTMNRPEQERCRACGRSLSQEKASPLPVGLRRVTGGEVFTAVLEKETPVPHPSASLVAEPVPEAKMETADEETKRVLAATADRLRERASRTGARFKPYSAPRTRTPERAEDRVVVAHQLESAARDFREKHYDTAAEHLLKAIAKDDHDPRSWALLGEVYLRCERPYKAAVAYLQALELGPQNGAAWLGLSRTLKSLGDLEGARDILGQSVQIHPNLAEAWSERGQVLEALNDSAAAAQSFARALELRPGHPAAQEAYERLTPAKSSASTAEGDAAPAAVPPEKAADESDELPDFADLAELPSAEPSVPATAAAKGHPARVRTYIEGLDETIAGGIPWGHVVLIEGSPGTMKSSVGFSILLHNAARDGLHCLYLSLEERTPSLLKQMASLGLHLHVNQGSLVVLDPRAAKGLLDERVDWVDALRAAVSAIRAQRGLDLIVIDSLEALEVLAKFTDRRREIFRLFEWLRDLDVTSFVITERPDWVVGGHVIQGRWDEDFLADGVVHLRQHLVSDLEVQRRLRVVKLRGTRHDTGYMALVLDDGKFRVMRAMSP